MRVARRSPLRCWWLNHLPGPPTPPREPREGTGLRPAETTGPRRGEEGKVTVPMSAVPAAPHLGTRPASLLFLQSRFPAVKETSPTPRLSLQAAAVNRRRYRGRHERWQPRGGVSRGDQSLRKPRATSHHRGTGTMEPPLLTQTGPGQSPAAPTARHTFVPQG